jgi:lycopene beta-cyclase
MFDLILAGGGLANGLLAYRLATQRPDIRLQMIEQADTLGGAHTWSFHATDLTPAENAWMAPFVVHQWDHYDVAFPTLMRRIEIPYRCVTSARFSDVVTEALGTNLRAGTRLLKLRPDGVTLGSGEVLRARAVIDGRGFRRSCHMVNRFQKFVGLEVRLAAPHGLSGPVLMDATVEQSDGYRFIYVLPFTPDVVLIEDTYYADTADIDADGVKDRILTYAASRGWSIAEVLREEVGVLPITLSGDMAAFWNEDTPGQPRVGLRAGMFHPTTGYSLPGAVKLADHIAAMPVLTSASIHEAVRKIASAGWQRHAFFRLLNRMLFLAGPSQERFRIMQRFYKMPQPLIGRFYGGDLSMFDKMQILTGWPPVSVVGAIKAIMATGR